MSLLDTLMQTAALPAFRRVMGDDAVYTPAYTPPAEPAPVATWAMLNRGLAAVGDYGERMERRLTVQLPKADVSDPQPGDTLTIGATTYRLDQVVADDGFLIEVAIR